jgi:hypothetical protein
VVPWRLEIRGLHHDLDVKGVDGAHVVGHSGGSGGGGRGAVAARRRGQQGPGPVGGGHFRGAAHGVHPGQVRRQRVARVGHGVAASAREAPPLPGPIRAARLSTGKGKEGYTKKKDDGFHHYPKPTRESAVGTGGQTKNHGGMGKGGGGLVFSPAGAVRRTARLDCLGGRANDDEAAIRGRVAAGADARAVAGEARGLEEGREAVGRHERALLQLAVVDPCQRAGRRHAARRRRERGGQGPNHGGHCCCRPFGTGGRT